MDGSDSRQVVTLGSGSRAVRVEVVYPNERELRRIVRQVVRGESGPLDTVVTGVIFGEKKPEIWGHWPPEAVRIWSRACELYYDLVQEEESSEWARGSRNDLTLPDSWDAILRVSPDPLRWWRLPGVTWSAIGRSLGLPSRLASYRMQSLGWRLAGAGMHVPDRRVVTAPCVNCGTTWGPDEIRRREGPCCLG
jgi:hypothetical protein